MNMKRVFVFGVLGIFLVSLMGGVLGADSGDEVGRNAAQFFKELGSGINTFFEEVFGAENGLSEFFFVILLAMVIYSTISTFFSQSNTVNWIITIAISGLALIGIPEGFIESLLASYGAMGITILTVIPFIIMFIFTINVKDLFMARGIWLVYFVYYTGVFISNFSKQGSDFPYWIAATAGVIMFLTVPYIRHFKDEETLRGKVEKAENSINRRKAGLDLEEERLHKTTGV